MHIFEKWQTFLLKTERLTVNRKQAFSTANWDREPFDRSGLQNVGLLADGAAHWLLA